jgi:hypothetical protein
MNLACQIFLILNLLILNACQMGPQLSESTDFYEDSGRFYLHTLGSRAKVSRVYIDGKEIKDTERLDKEGIVQKAGEHEIEFEGTPMATGLEEIDYKMQKNQDLHLYYCESNQSFHWFAGLDKKQVEAKKKALCGSQ